MTHTTREPCTKFFGPNARVRRINAPNGLYMQVFDVQPGDLWVPGLEAELYTKRYLGIYAGYQTYYFNSTNFRYRCQWYFNNCEFIIRYYYGGVFCFHFKPHYATNEWMICQIAGPTGVFAYGGRMVVSWQEGP